VTVADERGPDGVRLLALLGIVGGIALLAAFLVDIPPALNTVRLFLFLAGGVGVALAAHQRLAAISRPLALAGAVPLITVSAVHASWILLSLGRDRPFAGDFGLVGFYVGLALWLAQAWYGVVALRLGAMWRWAALALVIGSLLAITGMDRLELTSPTNPTIFGPVALLGIALDGIAWILLGVDLVLPSLRQGRPTAAAPTS
jgi:hypothetical protein